MFQYLTLLRLEQVLVARFLNCLFLFRGRRLEDIPRRVEETQKVTDTCIRSKHKNSLVAKNRRLFKYLDQRHLKMILGILMNKYSLHSVVMGDLIAWDSYLSHSLLRSGHPKQAEGIQTVPPEVREAGGHKTWHSGPTTSCLF